MSFEDSEGTQDIRSESLPHSGHEDAEKYLLLGEGSEPVRRAGFWRSPWSIRVLTSVTILNIVLFSISIVTLFFSNRVSRLSDQDYWRATSYYCTYLLPPHITRHRTTNTEAQPQYSTASTSPSIHESLTAHSGTHNPPQSGVYGPVPKQTQHGKP
jgi:hypothetical protein